MAMIDPHHDVKTNADDLKKLSSAPLGEVTSVAAGAALGAVAGFGAVTGSVMSYVHELMPEIKKATRDLPPLKSREQATKIGEDIGEKLTKTMSHDLKHGGSLRAFTIRNSTGVLGGMIALGAAAGYALHERRKNDIAELVDGITTAHAQTEDALVTCEAKKSSCSPEKKWCASAAKTKEPAPARG